jgi:hypothetical protein
MRTFDEILKQTPLRWDVIAHINGHWERHAEHETINPASQFPTCAEDLPVILPHITTPAQIVAEIESLGKKVVRMPAMRWGWLWKALRFMLLTFPGQKSRGNPPKDARSVSYEHKLTAPRRVKRSGESKVESTNCLARRAYRLLYIPNYIAADDIRFQELPFTTRLLVEALWKGRGDRQPGMADFTRQEVYDIISADETFQRACDVDAWLCFSARSASLMRAGFLLGQKQNGEWTGAKRVSARYRKGVTNAQ